MDETTFIAAVVPKMLTEGLAKDRLAAEQAAKFLWKHRDVFVEHEQRLSRDILGKLAEMKAIAKSTSELLSKKGFR